MTDVTYPAAALAGLLSFLSPCVLPLVPPYLTYLAGTTLDQLAGGRDASVNRRALIAALLFVAGFSTVFVLLGASASALGGLLRQHLVLFSYVAGALIIVMGLHFLGVFRIAFFMPRSTGRPGCSGPTPWVSPSPSAGRPASDPCSPRS